MKAKRIYKPRARAAYFREYRKTNQEALRAYWRERARRLHIKKPRLRVRQPRKPKAAELQAVKAMRLAAAESAITAERAASLAHAATNPELVALIRQQERDARRYQIKTDPGGFVLDDERYAA